MHFLPFWCKKNYLVRIEKTVTGGLLHFITCGIGSFSRNMYTFRRDAKDICLFLNFSFPTVLYNITQFSCTKLDGKHYIYLYFDSLGERVIFVYPVYLKEKVLI